MKTLRTAGELREVLGPDRRAGRHGVAAQRVGLVPTVGFVPTMGALHEGHLSLIRAAREQCDRVVVSLFVNPSQFDERRDLERYPRPEEHDARLAEEAGVDVLFAPSAEEVYPAGFATSVEVLGVTDRLEGVARGAAHFRGVTTVVTKLLGMVAPDVAYFGQKDAQQLAVIRRLVADLNIPVRIEAGPTIREPDGLAMSSRNALLDPHERIRACAVPRALGAARELAAAGELAARPVIDAARAVLSTAALEPDYVELVDPESFEALERLDRPALLVLAARVGEVRLIDNAMLEPARESLRARGGLESACSG
jgi:pantoate--beta-alanine ligase